MGQFLASASGDGEDISSSVEDVWYDLRGVLMHKGTSAHHGHYVAQVRDGRLVGSFGHLRRREVTDPSSDATVRINGTSLTMNQSRP